MTKLTKGPFKGKTMELAPQVELTQFSADQIEELLEILGFPEALITDMSALCDFPLDGDELSEIEKRYGITVTRTEYIVNVLARIHKGKN